MKNVIEIAVSTVEAIIPCLEGRLTFAKQDLEGAKIRVEELKEEIETLTAQINEVKTQLANRNVATTITARTGTPRQRLPKGQADKDILALLSTLPDGEGLSMVQIEEKTGLNHASVFRVLSKRNTGKFVQGSDKLWRISKG